MPIYSFEGRKERTGELLSGMREASSHAMLGQELLAEGVLLTRFAEQRQRSMGVSLISAVIGHVPILERVLFARYFSLMLRSGLDVKQSLLALSQQTTNKTLKRAIKEVGQSVERGMTLAEGMGKFPNVFPPIFISFVRVGETTGRLQESLNVLAEQLKKEYELRRAILGGLMYPVVIIVALVGVGFAMLVFVVPKLAEVFAGFNVQLPLTTRILLGMGAYTSKYWYIVILGATALGIGSWSLYRIKVVKDTVQQWLLYMPVVGPIVREINLARFTRNLSSLLKSGVSFVESLEILGDNTPHASYAKIFREAKDHVKQGKVLSDFLAEFNHLFPALVTNIIKVGEETGALDDVLQEVAIFYEGEVDQTMKNLTSIMEPVLMIAIGLAVGALAISVISPIYSLVNVI